MGGNDVMSGDDGSCKRRALISPLRG